jgi:mannosyltransferase OCH1-like enzyme
MNVPKIVHVTYKTFDSIPDHWQESIPAWNKLGWTVRFWSDEDNLQLVSESYPQYLDTYLNLEYNICRVDFVRACYMHKYGGLYCDLDIIPIRDVYNDLLQSELTFIMSPNTDWTITNMFFASVPGHPFWLDYMKTMANPKLPFFAITRHWKIMYTTGPCCLDLMVKNSNYKYTLLSRKTFSCDVCDFSACGLGKLRLVQGSSWNEWDSLMVKSIYCYRKMLFVLALFIICFIVYYITVKRNKK